MNYVYILRSQRDNGHYIGQTNNLIKRVKCHNYGMVKSTKSRRPLYLIYTEKFESRSEAIKREIYLKKLKGGNELKKILKSKTE